MVLWLAQSSYPAVEWAESIQMHWHCYPIQLNEWPFISHLMKLPESGCLFPPLFPLPEYGSSAEMELTLFTLTVGERWFWVKKTTAKGGLRGNGMTWPFDFSFADKSLNSRRLSFSCHAISSYSTIDHRRNRR